MKRDPYSTYHTMGLAPSLLRICCANKPMSINVNCINIVIHSSSNKHLNSICLMMASSLVYIVTMRKEYYPQLNILNTGRVYLVLQQSYEKDII